MLLICVAILFFVAIVAVFALFCLVYPSTKYDREVDDKEQEKFIEQYR